MRGYKVGTFVKVTQTDYVGSLETALLEGVHEIVESTSNCIYVKVDGKRWALVPPFDVFHKVKKPELEAK